MLAQQTLALVALASLGAAQRPMDTPICDYYTTALFKDNTAANQYALVKAVVDRAGTGNMTTTPPVNGIVVPGTFMNKAVDISVYFTGALLSTNRGGDKGVSVNFLDGNATDSNQSTLFAHLYEYFGALLGCSTYGMEGYPAYAGKGSQYEVHKFMDLDEYEVGYFNEQVGLSAASFGVTTDDVTAIGKSLNAVFNVKCAPPTTVVPAQGAQLQSICIADSCPLAVNSSCTGYATPVMPMNATMSNSTSGSSGSSGSASASGSGSASSTGSSPAQQTVNSAAGIGASVILGAVAFALAL